MMSWRRFIEAVVLAAGLVWMLALPALAGVGTSPTGPIGP